VKFITYAVACLSLREADLVWIWTWSNWRNCVSKGRKIYSHDIAPIINCCEDKVMWQRQIYIFSNVSVLLSCNATKH